MNPNGTRILLCFAVEFNTTATTTTFNTVGRSRAQGSPFMKPHRALIIVLDEERFQSGKTVKFC